MRPLSKSGRGDNDQTWNVMAMTLRRVMLESVVIWHHFQDRDVTLEKLNRGTPRTEEKSAHKIIESGFGSSSVKIFSIFYVLHVLETAEKKHKQAQLTWTGRRH